MKKLFLSALALSFAFFSRAQITRGTTFVGGNIGFNSSSSTGGDTTGGVLANPRNSSFSFGPTVSWAVKDNLVLGVTLGYSHSKNDFQSSNAPVNKTNGYSAGIFLRKYKPLVKDFSLFIQGGLGFSYSKATSSGGSLSEYSSDSWGPDLGLAAGAAYRLGKHWQAEAMLPNMASIRYYHQSSVQKFPNTPDYKPTSNSFSFGSSLSNYMQFTLGILYII